MRTLLPKLLMILLMSVLSAGHPDRMWTFQDGATVTGKMLSTDGSRATVMTEDARVLQIELDRLSAEDQAYVRDSIAREANTPRPTPTPRPPARPQQQAAQSAPADRPTLLFFTGSDWCPPCMQFERQVMNREPFRSYAASNLRFQVVDFPRRRQLPAAQQQANDELARRHNVRGFPTFILLDPRGRVMTRFGYGGQSPEDFVRLIRSHVN
jgi:thioredoxin-related protein